VALQFAQLDPRLHKRAGFRGGVPVLDAYLQQQAGQHQRDGIATTHVLTDDGDPARILGYCSLAAAQLKLHDRHAVDHRRLPAYPVPAVRLGRLAVATEAQGKGYGRLLLGHALNCSLALRGQLGVRVLVVDALDERAASFYRLHGFRETVEQARTLYLAPGAIRRNDDNTLPGRTRA
jgi:ribosomal protein S18 acetylase RimI-like enzyme